jgi:hypothetical protein
MFYEVFLGLSQYGCEELADITGNSAGIDQPLALQTFSRPPCIIRFRINFGQSMNGIRIPSNMDNLFTTCNSGVFAYPDTQITTSDFCFATDDVGKNAGSVLFSPLALLILVPYVTGKECFSI